MKEIEKVSVRMMDLCLNTFCIKQNRRMICLVAVALAATSVMAVPVEKTVVKWGEPGGDLDIITVVTGDSTTMDTTYATGNTITKEAPSTVYYESYVAAEDTPLFNGAGSLDGNLEVRTATDGDAFYYPRNLGTGSHQHMFAWEVGLHTLNSGGTLKSFTVENKLRAANNSGTRRFLIKESGTWYISESNTLSTAYTSWSIDPSTLEWFEFTPFSSGSYSIGTSASPTFENYEAVGVYYDVAVVDGTWADVRTRYFKVTTEITKFTIVKWGEPGGDSGIIVTNADGDSTTINTTYTSGNTITLNDPSADYYENYNASTDTPLFNGAGSFDGKLEVRGADDGDNFYSPINNALTEQRMYAWETGVHTLTNGGKLVKFTVENRMRDSGSTGTRRFLIKESGSWYVSETNSINPTVYTSWSVDPEMLEWFEFTPFSGGTYSIGASASPKFRNYEAVGLFFESKHNTSGWHHPRTRYFHVEADDIPLPPLQGTIILLM